MKPAQISKLLLLFILFGGVYLLIRQYFPFVLPSFMQLGSYTQNNSQPREELGEVVNDVSLALEEEGAKVPLEKLLRGCSGKDCIPAINNPSFESIAEADKWLEGEDRIFILTFNDQTKLYPQKIMNRHEIVNDWYGNSEEETAIAVTFCPLCGSATAFERKVNGTITQFGVSGRLHNSDLVMYDRLEGNLWQQISGEAITGPAARRDELLKPLLLLTMEWKQVKEEYPKAEVLQRLPGLRGYDAYPYGTYEKNGEIYFGVDNEDSRLHPKAWIYGLEIEGETKAYPQDLLIDGKVFKDTLGGVSLSITTTEGITSFINTKTGEEVVPLKLFWFAWVAFHPDTVLYSN
jgi:hypothetical protein